MSKFVLSPRLLSLISLSQGSCIADIGCDHGYVAIALKKSGKFEKVIASDIKKGPLSSAKKNIRLSGEDVETRLSNGLLNFKSGEIDSVVIGGMGGMVICSILESADLEKIRFLTLQPMTDMYLVRKCVHSLGYKITSEDLSLENDKLYSVIACEKGQDSPYSELEYHIGKKFLDKRYFDVLIKKNLKRFKNRYEGLLKEKNTDDKQISYYKNLIDETEMLENEN